MPILKILIVLKTFVNFILRKIIIIIKDLIKQITVQNNFDFQIHYLLRHLIINIIKNQNFFITINLNFFIIFKVIIPRIILIHILEILKINHYYNHNRLLHRYYYNLKQIY